MNESDNAHSANSIHGAAPALEVRGLNAGYGDLTAVRDVNFVIYPGEIVALLGPNGAGKTTTLLTVAGAIPALGGSIYWNGKAISSPLDARVRMGLGFIPEERSVINSLSVRDNLRLGRGSVKQALQLFPQLEPLQRRPAGLLSGGEQQMLTLARCLASQPTVMLVDELSLGLAPIVVKSLFKTLQSAAADTGSSVLLVEQQIERALLILDRWYLLRNGALVDSGTAAKDDVRKLTAGFIGGAS